MARSRAHHWLVSLGLALLVVFASTASAQFTSFGKNKVQYHDFTWHTLKSAHFELFFYPEEEELARRTLVWAEEYYDDLSHFFGHEVSRRVPLIIYSTHIGFAQTNVTPFFLPEGVAGLTEFVKGRVVMPFNGSYSQFRTTLHHELVHVFQLSLVSSVYQNYARNEMASPPLWLTEGLADYVSDRWGGPGEMILTDLVVGGRLPDIDDLWRYNGTFAIYKIGQRLTEFLVETYGTDVINRIYENLWVSAEFTQVLEYVTGDRIGDISQRWHLREQRYVYPAIMSREPVPLEAKRLTSKGPSFKPQELPKGILGDDERRFLFVSPRTGYTSIYAASMDGRETDALTLVAGEREAHLESLHPFVSRIDVNDEGQIAFVSKWHDSDALLIYDITSRRIVSRHQFDRIVGIKSPAWSPDGESIVFQGLTEDAYSDLFMMSIETEALTRLTHDHYEDIDPDVSPDGKSIVFVSDRSEYGEAGNQNLFLLDLETRRIRYLTRGPWVDTAPRFAPDGEHVYFASSRMGSPDLYEVDLTGTGRRLTKFLSGAIDPSPSLDGKELLFTGFASGNYHTYVMPVAAPTDSTETFALAQHAGHAGWRIDSATGVGKSEAARYSRRFSLDFAAGGVAFDPVQTDASGAQLAFTDMLGDEVLNVQLGNTVETGSEFFSRLNVATSYFNLRRRFNYGVGVYHYAGDFRDSRDLPFFERRAGVSLLGSYPFSKFRRVEASMGLAYSDKRNDATDVDRRAYLVTNSLSWVHDNSLWVPTGPIDGTRIRGTVAMQLDLPRSEVEGVELLADYRRYFRAGARSAWATRVQGLLSVGSDPRYWSLGGTHTLRGYPRREIFGTRSLLVNNEYRFPLVDGFLIGFPFGAVEFPGIQGALFTDAGWIWNEDEDMPWPPLGSLGASLRMSFGGFLVFRLDFARRTNFKKIEPNTRTDFFIGWDY